MTDAVKNVFSSVVPSLLIASLTFVSCVSIPADQDEEVKRPLAAKASAEADTIEPPGWNNYMNRFTWALKTKKNDAKSYKKIIKKYPNTFLAEEANRWLTNSEYAFFQTARIGSEKAVREFIKFHSSSERIPIAKAYLDYLDKVKWDNIKSARKFINSSPDNPFAHITKVRFPLIYLQDVGARVWMKEFEVIRSPYRTYDERQKRAQSNLAKRQKKWDFEFTEEQHETTTHRMEVLATGTVSAAEAFARGLNAISAQVNLSMATYRTSSDPVVNAMRSNAQQAILGGAYSSNNPTPQYSEMERLHITIKRASDGDVIYSDIEGLTTSAGPWAINWLLIERSPEVKLASSMVLLSYSTPAITPYLLALNNDFESTKAFLSSVSPEFYLDETPHSGVMTALMVAVNNGSLELASLLIANGAAVDKKTSLGTALLLAVSRKSDPVVNLLLNNGADVDIPNINGFTPLMAATDDTELVELLLEHGANVNHQDKQGDSALILAAEFGRAATVQILLDSGADVSIRNDDGKTASQIASEKGHAETVKLLRGVGAID